MRRLRVLLLAAHPGPAAAVTLFALALGVVAGAGVRTLPLVVAVAAGQLSIGWLNDLLDADRDRVSARADKPLARGDVDDRTVRRAIAVAALVLVAGSACLGWRAGLLDVGTVACGWAYDLGVKSTAASPVPYALAFGALPSVATLTTGHWPAAWVTAAGALLGTAAHFANVLPDLADDAATGVRGLPHRCGARGSLVVAVVLLVAGTVAVVVGAPSPLSYAALGVVVAAVAVTGPAFWRRPGSRLAFVGLIVMAGVDVVALLGTGRLR